MKIGVGHFEFTSAWDGNVGISGHNRGVPAAIGGIKDLKNGDEIIYSATRSCWA
jgi:sortase (surface protein transpeptidase)